MSGFNWIVPSVTERQVLSIAGIMQGIVLIEQLAETGRCDHSAYERCLHAVLELTPERDEDVFGEPGDLNLGFSATLGLAQAHLHKQQLSYLTQLLYLEKRVMKEKALVQNLTDGLRQAKRQYEYNQDISTTSAKVGDLYQETVGRIGHRMQIYGKQEFLSQPDIAAKVRTLLLASIRFTLLWRQSGGRPMQSVLRKDTIFKIATQLKSI